MRAVEWLVEQLKINNYISVSDNAHSLINVSKKMENDYKLKNQLFIGKVIDVIGFDKTLELLKECENAFKQ